MSISSCLDYCRPLHKALALLPVTVLLVCFFPWVAQADLHQQRIVFGKVEQALKRGDRSMFIRHAQDLADYPLYPYLQFYDLKPSIHLNQEDRIKSFLQRHEHSPAAEWLRYQWLNYLAQQAEWKAYAAYYRPAKTHNDVRYACWYARALIRHGGRAAATKAVRALWLSAQSQPAACDAVFAWGLKHHVIDTELRWQRFLLALQQGPSHLTRYLYKLLPAEVRPWAQRARRAYQQERQVIRHIDVDYSASHYAAEVMKFAMQRLMQGASQEAALAWKKIQNRCHPRCRRLLSLERDIGIALMRDFHAADAYRWLSGLPVSARDEQVQEWIVLAALRAGWWRRAVAAIEAMATEHAAQPQWQYWKAHSLHALGSSSAAAAIWQRLAQQNNYYAYLAADQLNVAYALRSQPIIFTQRRIAKLSAVPALQRIREFVALHRLFDARREWNFVRETLSTDDLAAAAILFDRWGWLDGTIRATADGGHLGDLVLRFPIKYKQLVEQEAARYHLPREWVYGVIRRESAFMEAIKSPAGALGLMQLTPKTANSLAAEIAMKSISNWRLLTPDINIRLGAAYLKKMYQRYDNNLVFALAAYNAGPTRLDQWFKQAPPTATTVWIDTIPFGETRAYIRNVLFYVVAYRYRLGLPVMRLSTLMRAPSF